MANPNYSPEEIKAKFEVISGTIERAEKKIVYEEAAREQEIKKLINMGYKTPVEAEDALEKKEKNLDKMRDELEKLQLFIIEKYEKIAQNLPEEIAI